MSVIGRKLLQGDKLEPEAVKRSESKTYDKSLINCIMGSTRFYLSCGNTRMSIIIACT